VDAFRDDMFALRDELFALAQDGQLSFHAPAYGLLRTTLNGFIRYGHRTNIISFLIFAARVPAEQQEQLYEMSPGSRLSRARESLPPETREALAIIETRMHTAVLKQLMLGSPWLLALALAAIPCFVLPMAGKQLIDHFVARVYKRFETALDEKVFPVFDDRAFCAAEVTPNLNMTGEYLRLA